MEEVKFYQVEATYFISLMISHKIFTKVHNFTFRRVKLWGPESTRVHIGILIIFRFLKSL